MRKRIRSSPSRQTTVDQRRIGACFSKATGHFGEFVQGKIGAMGPVALATAPAPHVTLRARLNPVVSAPLLVTGPDAGDLARKAVRRGSSLVEAVQVGGRLTLSQGGRAPLGGGAGLSTLISLTSLRAAAAAVGAVLTAEQEAACCLAVEGASDPLMYADAGRLVWASRLGRILERTAPGARFVAVGGFDGPPVRTRADDNDFPDVADLFQALIDARAAGDAAQEALTATESAKRNQRRNPKPRWRELVALQQATGALGLIVAHTGSAVALLFEPDRADLHEVSAAMSRIGVSYVREFEVGQFVSTRSSGGILATK